MFTSRNDHWISMAFLTFVVDTSQGYSIFEEPWPQILNCFNNFPYWLSIKVIFYVFLYSGVNIFEMHNLWYWIDYQVTFHSQLLWSFDLHRNIMKVVKWSMNWPNGNVLFQTHLLFMTIYGSLNIRWHSCTQMCHWLCNITYPVMCCLPCKISISGCFSDNRVFP